MFLNMKNRISELLNTISEYVAILHRLNDPLNAVSDCIAGLQSIQSQLSKENPIPFNVIKLLGDVQLSLQESLSNEVKFNEQLVEVLNGKMNSLKNTFEVDIKAKLNVVFFPYKASMWDSLETIYKAALEDSECVVQVVPIPYFVFSNNEATYNYEGDLFPEDVPITHYSQYHLEQEQPDIVYVHNIYDNHNSLTCVHEEYFTSNLKKYTDMLVYVPYHVSSFVIPQQGEARLAYSVPTIENIDRIILVADFLKEAAIREGVPSEKLLVLGSPKLDAMVNTLRKESLPSEWREKLAGKRVYLINTGCLYFANNPYTAIEQLTSFFSIPHIDEHSVVIWRPHPLTKASILKYIPDFAGYYINLIDNCINGENKLYENIIFDETADYLPALQAADVLISADGSLLRSFILTEKKVIYWGDELPEQSLVPTNAFYYAYNQSEPWFRVVKNFSNGLDPLADYRKNLASKIYANTDGTAGRKIYQAIKDEVWTSN